MATQTAAQQYAQLVATNAVQRQNLLNTAPRMVFKSPTFTQTGTQEFRQKIQNFGVLTSIDLLFTVTLANSGASVANPQVGMPYNLISKIKLTDWGGIDRSNLSGLQLAELLSIRNRKLWNSADAHTTGDWTGPDFAYPTNSTIPAAVGGVPGTATQSFYLRLPVSYTSQDLTGALVLATNTGETYLTVDVASAFTGAFDAPYDQNTVSVTSWTCQWHQNYLQPKYLDATNTPALDFSTVYELATLFSNDNIFANQVKMVNYPNARVVRAAYMKFANGGYNFGTDMTSVKKINSGNTAITDYLPIINFLNLREIVSSDMTAGLYYFDDRALPIATDSVGQVQIQFVPNTVANGAYINTLFESTYNVQMALPGLNG